MSNRRLGILLAWLVPLIFTVIGPYSVNDLAQWIALGRHFWQNGELLRLDTFSVFRTEPLVYPTWGVAVLYAWIYDRSGLVWVCLFHSLALSALLWLVYRRSILTLKNPSHGVARVALYVFWLGAVPAFGERPSLIALLPLVLGFGLISDVRGPRDLTVRRIVALVGLMVVWVNIHGSFILLLGMLGWKVTAILVTSRDRRNTLIRGIAAGAAVLAAAFVNPFTYRVFPFVLETARKSMERGISEWVPTTLGAHFPTGALYWLLVGGVVWELARRRPGIRIDLSSPFFFLLVCGALAVRNAALPFVVLLPALKTFGFLDAFDRALPGITRPRRMNVAVAAAFVVLLVAVAPQIKPRLERFLPEHRRALYDNTAVFRLAEAVRNSGRECPVFNGREVGSFLMLVLPNRVFFDGRNIPYRSEDFQAYLNASQAGPGWEALLKRHGTCFAILDRVSDAPLVRELSARPEWRVAGEEQGNLLFELHDSVATGPIRDPSRHHPTFRAASTH